MFRALILVGGTSIEMNTPRRTELPAHLRAFLYSCIDSVDQLDVLCLLQESGQAWTVRAVGRQLGIPERRVRTYLDSLAARGLARVTVGKDLTYSFRPANATLGGYCTELAVHMASARTDIITFVASLPPLSIRAFASAFKIREQD